MKKRKQSAITGVLVVILLFLHAWLFSQEKPIVVMLSLDGFRWDYPQRAGLTLFDSLARSGVSAKAIRPSFPSITFPNHYSMATGLYPDHHGIVANSFYDPDLKRHYAIRDRSAVEDGVFYGGEPLWVTAEKQGMISASFYWVGSEAPVKGIRPTYWKRYDQKVPFASRTDTVIAWLSLPEEKRPHLVMLYYHEPDGTGHDAGPESEEVKMVVKELEQEVRNLIRKLNSLPIAASINLIVTTDHGMQSTGKDRSVVLSDFINPEWFDVIEGYSPIYLFKPKKEMADTALAALQRIPHTKAWRSKKVPAALHYGSNPRTLDVVLLADSGWTIRKNIMQPVPAGAHGYDPANTNMHGIFYATGPAFKKDYPSPGFENVDLYPLVCRILGLKPAPVDGKLSRVEEMLRINGAKQ